MKKLIFIIAMLPLLASAQPDVISSGGNYAQSSNVQISYTIGQAVYAAGQGSSVSVTQGFQQPEYIITEVNNNDNTLDVKLYPNPTLNDVVVDFYGNFSGTYTAKIYDLSGKMLSQTNITSNSQKLNLRNYPAGNYLIKITQGNKQKTFKVIKK